MGRGALLVVLCLSTAAFAAERYPFLFIRGNRVIIDEVYRTVLDLPAAAKADPATAREVRSQLRQFLRAAGYTLARVRTRLEGTSLVAEVDEGHLEKIVFVGAGSLRTLQLKLRLSMPHHVFNRPFLERQLEGLRKRYSIPSLHYRLIPITPVTHHGPQLKNLGEIQGVAGLRPWSRYELHIFLSTQEWDTGLGADLNYDFPDGLEVSLRYRGQDLLFSGDRWMIGGTLGGKLREEIDTGETYPVLSHAALEWRWYTPSLLGRGFRPFLWLNTDLTSRQRSDLSLEIYYNLRMDATLNLGYEAVRGLMFSLGGGVEEKLLFGFEIVGTPAQAPGEGDWLQPFVVGRVEFTFNPLEPRRDRRNQVVAEARHYFVDGTDGFGRATYQAQVLVPLGWHDFWVRSRGAWLWGEVPFDEEEPVGGRYLRGCFGDRYYVREVGNLVLEFRLSLARDLFKAGFFHDLAVFGQQDRAAGTEQIRIADSFGVGFHALVLDLFQLDLYYAMGFTSEESDFDYGVAASLKKVF